MDLIYSIQRTYIINLSLKSGAPVLTCNQRIDVPVIEPLANVQSVVYSSPRIVVPCVELKIPGASLDDVNIVFETNEGETVLPVKIKSGQLDLSGNPYIYARWVLALPRGTTGIKSCKVILGDNDTIKHNFTFGIMPPPYNYDNALFSLISHQVEYNRRWVSELEDDIASLKARVAALENKAGE